MGKVFAVLVAFGVVFGLNQVWPWLHHQPGMLSVVLVVLLAAVLHGLGKAARDTGHEEQATGQTPQSR